MVRGWISGILKIHRIFCCTRFVEKGMANIERAYYIYLAVSAESRDITGLFKIKHCSNGKHNEKMGHILVRSKNYINLHRVDNEFLLEFFQSIKQRPSV